MKANKKFVLDNKGAFTSQSVIILVGLLIAIVIGVLVYYEVSDIDDFNERTETFTGYTAGDAGANPAGSNNTATTVNLTNSPLGTAQVNVTCYNASHSAAAETGLSYPTFTVNHKSVYMAPEAADPFTQINVTYTSRAGTAEADDITPMAGTVFELLPLIALVVVAAVILGLIIGFGGGRRRGV